MSQKYENTMSMLHSVLGIYFSKYETFDIWPSQMQCDMGLDILNFAQVRLDRGDFDKRVLGEGLTMLSEVFSGPLHDAEISHVFRS